MNFYFNDTTELDTYSKWKHEHDKTCPFYDDGTQISNPVGAIGGRLTYCFTPTGLGVVTVIKCACGAEVNVTDFASW